MGSAGTITAVQLFIALVAVTAAVGIVLHRLAIPALPYSVALVISGLIIGLLLPELHTTVTPQLVLVVILPGLVFEASYHLDFAELRRSFGGVALLAVPGVLISALLVALALNVGTGMPLQLGFVVGAMVAATDPVAVVSTFQRLHVPLRLDTLVESESLFNDGTGLLAFSIALQVVVGQVSGGTVVVDFVLGIVVSVVIGGGIGWLASRLLRSVDDHLLEVTVSLVVAYGSYLLADAIHQSGVIATVVAGVVLGNFGPERSLSPRAREALDTVWEFAAFLLTAVVFLLVGLATPLSGLAGALPWIAWGVAGALIGRAIVTYGLLGVASQVRSRLGGRPPIPVSWLHVLFWAGLRGAVAAAVALSLPLDFPQRDLLQEITFGVILFTLLVQGTTVELLVRRSGALHEPAATGEWAAPQHEPSPS
jgi:Na+:H+ antiporter